MASRHRNSSRNTTNIPYAWILFGLAALWICISSIVKKSPIDTVIDSVYNVIGDSTLASLTYDELLQIQLQKDSSILSLTTALDKCKNASPYRKGIIEIQDNFVNMRSLATLSSAIVMKVPNSAQVDVLLIDPNEYVLDNKTGNWYKVKYADAEGYIWGNFVRILSQD